MNLHVDILWAWIAQSVWRLATGWTAPGSNLRMGEIYRTNPDRAWGTPSLLYNGYRVFFRVKRVGKALTTHPHLAPSLKKEYSYTSTPRLVLRGRLQGELFMYIFQFHLTCEL
jgi:hypothetical protein